MKKKMIRSLSLILTLVSLCSSLSIVSLAVSEDELLEAQIQQEIEQTKALVFESAHRQLEAQNATRHMDAYIALFTPQIEHGIRAKYAAQAGETYSPQELTKYAFTYGGSISYISLNVQVFTTYFGKKDTTCRIVKNGTDVLAKEKQTQEAIGMVIDLYDHFGLLSANLSAWITILQQVGEARLWLDELRMSEVEEHGYASVSYFTDALGTSTVLNVWELYPFVYADATLEDFQYEQFARHDTNCPHIPSCFS